MTKYLYFCVLKGQNNVRKIASHSGFLDFFPASKKFLTEGKDGKISGGVFSSQTKDK